MKYLSTPTWGPFKVIIAFISLYTIVPVCVVVWFVSFGAIRTNELVCDLFDWLTE